jgi:hypothetical protein
MSGGPEEELMVNPFLVVTECGQHQKGEHNNDIELGEEVTDGDGTWGEQMEGGGEAEVRWELGGGGSFYIAERALGWPSIKARILADEVIAWWRLMAAWMRELKGKGM